MFPTAAVAQLGLRIKALSHSAGARGRTLTSQIVAARTADVTVISEEGRCAASGSSLHFLHANSHSSVCLSVIWGDEGESLSAAWSAIGNTL